jgi:tripartite motif-containing protein 71
MGGEAFWPFMQPKAFTFVWGEVILDEPLVGATLSIFDIDGNKVFEEKKGTHTTGAFFFRVAWGIGERGGGVPSGFRIVATGGTLGNTPFTGSVLREVHEYSEGDYYTLNGITTLIAAYKSKHPEIGYVEAEETVKQFLDVPSQADITYLIDHSEWDESIFDHSVFMIQAEDAGGFDTYIDLLTKEIEAGGRHPIRNGQFVRAGWGSALSFMGSSIAKGVIGWGAGQAVGWIAHSLGYRTPSERMIEEVKKQLSEINRRLDQQSKQLTEIQNTLHKLEKRQEEAIRKIDHLTQRLEEVYKGLKEYVKWQTEITALKTRSSTIITNIMPPISSIKVTYDSLYRYSKVDFAKVFMNPEQRAEIQRSVNKTVDETLSPISGIEPRLETLHQNIVGPLGEKGLLEVWSMLLTIGATDTDHLREMHQAFENRFAYLLGVELTGISIMIDAYHGRYRNDTTIAEEFWKAWKGRIKEQVEQYVHSVERLSASRIDTLTEDEFNNHISVYAPPTILQKADKFARQVLSSLESADETSQSCITVRVVNYPHVTDQNLPADIGLQLQNVKTGKTYPAESVERRDGVTIPDRRWNTVEYELLYHAFSVPIGTYKIRDLDLQFSDIIRRHDYIQKTTLTPSDRYGSRGITAYYHRTAPVFYAKWGSEGSGDGQFIDPSGVDVDSTGNVYVADNWNRIQKFDSNGKFLLKWGSEGSGDGQFSSLRTLAVDSANNVYAADSWNHRIQKFDSNGKFMLKWGSEGGGDWSRIPAKDGQFSNPYGLAVDIAGNVYVSDHSNHRIQKFDSNGKFMLKWGSHGYGPGQFSGHTGSASDGPIRVALDPSGNVYVAQGWPVDRIHKFDSNGNFIMRWGSWGTLSGEFQSVSDVTADSTGNVYVVDSWNHRIQKFDSNGKFLLKWGSEGSGEGQFGSGSGTGGPLGVTVNSEGNVYVADTLNHRIQKFDSNGKFLLKWGSEGSEGSHFKRPMGIIVDTSGNVYVADSGNNRVQKFDSNGKFLLKWGAKGSEDGQFYEPRGAAVDSAGNVYISDSFNYRIQKFDSNGKFIIKWGRYGQGDSQFADDYGSVAVDSAGNVYVADAQNGRIQKFDSNGRFILKWGSRGNGPGQFPWSGGMYGTGPYKVAVDSSGNVYVAQRDRIHKFDSKGNFILRWGSSGALDGEFAHFVTDLAADSAGYVYVADSGNKRIQKFDSNGKFILKWGSRGRGDGQFGPQPPISMCGPMGICLDSEGDVYVTDTWNHRIQRFSLVFVSKDW